MFSPSFHAAAHDGDLAAVQALIGSLDININANDPVTGKTALHCAAEGNHVEVLDCLLSLGAECVCNSTYFRGPFQLAAAAGAVECVDRLLDSGKVEVDEDFDGTALEAAAQHGCTAVVQLLLERGANVDGFRGQDGLSPLHTAALWGKHECAAILLQHGAAAGYCFFEDEYQTPLDLATQRGHIQIMELLLAAGVDVNDAPDQGKSALHHAAESGQADAATLLLCRGADAGAKFFGYTALHLAILQKHIEVVALLAKHTTEKKIDINIKTNRGSTPLTFAASLGYAPAVKILIECQADVNAAGGEMVGSPLFQAAANGHREVVNVLMEAGGEMKSPASKLIFSHTWRGPMNFPLLAAAGFRDWTLLPTPCPGLEKALFAVWRRKDSEHDLAQLFARLEEEVKLRVRAALRCLHRVQPGLFEVLRMQILGAALSS